MTRADQESAAIRVLIAAAHLPHYRYDLFTMLETDARITVDFAGDKDSGTRSIPSIPAAFLGRVRRLRNTNLGRFLWQRGLVALVLQGRYDVIVCTGDISYLSTWPAAALARLLRIHVLFWTIGWHRPDPGARRLFRLMFYRLANGLLLYADGGRELGIRMGYPPDRMTVIHNSSSEPIPGWATSTRPLAEFRSLLPPAGRPVVTAVIRLNRVKRLDLLIEAVSLLPPGQSRPSVLLVGAGPELESLTRLAESLGVDLCALGPTYDPAELAAVYERTTVTVVPSAAGLTVLHSLKHGRPVITHDNPDEQMPEAEAVLPGITGDLYHYGEVDDLSRTIGEWVAIQSVRSTETAQACHRVVRERWSADYQAGLIGDQIAKALSGTSGKPRGREVA